ncbi:MBOAT family O-acyltransferase [Clostridium guangxiense]|uniref:MBOAT family O-acyltransferase n=1 Tax=Clostridium guangxiense TaxID=1662055 RepID=UPI001E3EB65D|nr:MBOAT family protein [Clostridium guangxiense]
MFNLQFNSLEFLVFFFLVTTVYYIIPHKVRWIWILISSYYFYLQTSHPKYIILLLGTTFISYLSGLLIEASDKKQSEKVKKSVLIGSILCNIGFLFLFKYYDFFMDIAKQALASVHIYINMPKLGLALPVGISFYTFEAVGYIIDVYRRKIKAEKNLAKYALFIAFFPQLLAGPIERAKHMLSQFEAKHSFNYEKVKSGLLLILWGLFQKLVVADRLSKLVDTVFSNPDTYKGFNVVIASIFFTFQIYCDFSGYSDMAIGVARVLGFELTRNFERPYFSKSVREFWRRWHITLCSWFKDYLYIPLGGNRCSKIKNYRNIMIVFIVSGLWHGAALNFIVWGTLHGVYQVVEKILEPLKNKVVQKLKINDQAIWYKCSQVLITFILVDFAWIFFKANTLSTAVKLIKNMFYFNPWVFTDGSLYNLGLTYKEFIISLLGIAVILAVNFLQRKNILYKELKDKNIAARWSVYLAIVVIIIIFGVYGPEYNPQQFIYFQF